MNLDTSTLPKLPEFPMSRAKNENIKTDTTKSKEDDNENEQVSLNLPGL